MKGWHCLPHIWYTLPRSERIYMMAISEGESRIDHAALED